MVNHDFPSKSTEYISVPFSLRFPIEGFVWLQFAFNSLRHIEVRAYNGTMHLSIVEISYSDQPESSHLTKLLI